MAQHDYAIANGTGAAVRSDINNALAAIVSQNSGATEPATTYAYMPWADTTAGVMKIRNGANSAWITLYQLDGDYTTISVDNGTAAAPSIYFNASGTDTGFYSPGTDQVGISTGGTLRLTTSTTAFTGTLPWQGQNGTAGVPALSFSGDTNTGIYNVGADQLGISAGGTLRLTTSTTAVTSTLPVVHPLGTVSAPGVTFTSDLNTGMWSPAADTVAISNNGIETLRTDSSNRLLLGLTTARTNFDAGVATPFVQYEGTDVNTTRSIAVTYGGADASGARLILAKQRSGTIGGNTIVQSTDTLGVVAYQASNGTNFNNVATIAASMDGTPSSTSLPTFIAFNTTASGALLTTEAMRINSQQELLIGYTTDNGAYKLQVNSQIFATSATIATSDGRYKENVATLNGCFDLIKALRPVSFTWKPQQPITRINEDGEEVLVREAHNFPAGTQVGFIAQEVQEVLDNQPWLDSVIKRNVRAAVTDPDGNELAPEEEFYGIAEGNLIAVLTSALQEAIAKIEVLETKVAALEASN